MLPDFVGGHVDVFGWLDDFFEGLLASNISDVRDLFDSFIPIFYDRS